MIQGFLLAYLTVLGFELILETLNMRHMRRHGHVIPPSFEGALEPAALARTAAYTADLKRVGVAESLVGSALVLLFLFVLLPGYDALVHRAADSFVGGGVLFFLGIALARTILGIPFDLWRTFGVEARYGFNTTTPRLWIQDLLKGLLLSLVLLGLLAAGALWLIQASPGYWWLWVWLFFFFFTLLILYLSPYVIEPLFFKFDPVRREGLEEGIRGLMQQAGLQVSRVFQVDASRRSRHSNAYFTGLGRVKRIVLFDTLLAQMEDREILAVLAHEVGHWKKRHILKRLLGMQVGSLAALYLGFLLLEWGAAPRLVGMEGGSLAAQATILAVAAGVAAFPLTPLGSWLSRRHEWQADRFASRLSGRPQDLASALVKMARENLANLHPHPLYAWFHYSHPPLVQRVERLLEAGKQARE